MASIHLKWFLSFFKFCKPVFLTLQNNWRWSRRGRVYQSVNQVENGETSVYSVAWYSLTRSTWSAYLFWLPPLPTPPLPPCISLLSLVFGMLDQSLTSIDCFHAPDSVILFSIHKSAMISVSKFQFNFFFTEEESKELCGDFVSFSPKAEFNPHSFLIEVNVFLMKEYSRFYTD